MLSQTGSTDPDLRIPRPEHPRPDFQREPWRNLNGRWRFGFDPENVGEQKRWYRVPHPAVSAYTGGGLTDPFCTEIVVPFPWESRLSGVGATEYKGAAWYQRAIAAPAEWAEVEHPTRVEHPHSLQGRQRTGEPPIRPCKDGIERGPLSEQSDASAGPRDAQGLPSVEDSVVSAAALGAQAQWLRNPILCFGAVDWHARVWVNGRFAGEHRGGYTPFEIDLSRYVRPGQPATLTVRAWDVCDADTPLGKQSENWYTHSGGIWQTVWLEGRPAAHIAQLRITPHLEGGTPHSMQRRHRMGAPIRVDGRATFKVLLACHGETGSRAFRLSVTSGDDAFSPVEETVELAVGTAEHTLTVSVPEPRSWSPEDPHLYACTVRLAKVGDEEAVEDAVGTYFGLRSISRGFWDGNPYEYVLLNGEPIYMRGALDQAFHPDGVHTYPSDDAIRADVEAAKALGLNMLRCHIKVNEPRYYYWADRLGILVMYDLPSALVYTPSAREYWEETLRAAIARDASHPSVFAWVLFNETWGLEEHQTPASWAWVREMVDLAKRLDPTRLVEDNSANLYDHVRSDLNTWHFYLASYDRARRHVERVVSQTYAGSPFNYVSHRYPHVEGASEHRQETEPLLNSEYAGLGARGGDRDIAYTFKFLTTELRRHAKICGYVYTELTDIEWEHNGLLNYDRSRKEFGYESFVPGMSVADLNRADFVGLDAPPCQTLPPGAVFEAPLFVSHWDRRPLERARVCWRISAVNRFGEKIGVEEGERPVAPRRYSVTEAGSIPVRLPEEACLVTVAVRLKDGDGEVRALNYVNVDVSDGRPLPAMERTERGTVVRFRPGDFLDASWPTPTIGPGGEKFGGAGAGWVEYPVAVPEEVDLGAVRRLRLLFEAGARTASSRVGWRLSGQATDRSYPQTEARKLGSTIQVSVNGVELGTARLPDDPADARGVLSAHLSESFEYASYGFRTELEVEGEGARRVLAASANGVLLVRIEVPRGGTAGGLNLYGARMGALPIDPMLFLER